MKKQNGSTLVVALLLLAVLGTAIAYLWLDRNSARADLKTAQTQLTQAQNDRDEAVEETKKMKNQLDMKDSLLKASQATSAEYVATITDLSKKVTSLTSKLPKVIPKKNEAPTTVEAEDNSLKRIEIVWQVYCTTQPSLIEPRVDGLDSYGACILRKDGVK